MDLTRRNFIKNIALLSATTAAYSSTGGFLFSSNDYDNYNQISPEEYYIEPRTYAPFEYLNPGNFLLGNYDEILNIFLIIISLILLVSAGIPFAEYLFYSSEQTFIL
jgi:hypothetical protein|tara:strand:- start:64 stop:384 length:321 start_codon:yes stop_codon:yes gene_type:complete